MKHTQSPTGTGCVASGPQFLVERSLGSALAPLNIWALIAINDLKKPKLKKPSSTPRPSRAGATSVIITQHAAECVEELLNNVRFDQGKPWFLIVERKMKRLVSQVTKL